MNLRKIFRIALLGVAGVVLLFGIIHYHSDIPVSELDGKYLTPQSRYQNVMGTRMHIRIRGGGRPIFLLHGSFSSLHTWSAWEDVLDTAFQTISIDLPGHGLTGPEVNGDYRMSHMAEMIFALADSLEIDRFAVAGNSMGGQLAWMMAVAKPERISRLILVDAAGMVDSTRKETPLAFKVLSAPVINTLATRITPRFLFTRSIEEVYVHPDKVPSTTLDRYYDLLLREGNRDAILTRFAQREAVTLKEGVIACPTLIIWGDTDRWISPDCALQFKQRIANSELIMLSETGHVPMEENPLESVKAAITFLQRPLTP